MFPILINKDVVKSSYSMHAVASVVPNSMQDYGL